MKIAYVLFDDITLLDFIGIYDPLSRLRSNSIMPDLNWHTVAFSATIKDNFGVTITPDLIQPDLSTYDMVFIPGGHGTRQLIHNEPFLNWIRSTSETSLKTSVCTGSLVWGAAGFLTNRRATTHFAEYKTLEQFNCTVEQSRIVDDGNIITAGAVAASLDLGLYLCNKWCGKEAMELVRKKMHYDGSFSIT
jgi:transcriptional regulator GlxA family with amidase domain